MIQPQDAPGAFQSAWNHHDMQEFGALFHPDATFVNRFGHYVRGVDQIVALHAGIHATIYSDSTLVNELIDVIPLGDAAAVVHFWCRLTTGAARLDETLRVAVMRRQQAPRRWFLSPYRSRAHAKAFLPESVLLRRPSAIRALRSIWLTVRSR